MNRTLQPATTFFAIGLLISWIIGSAAWVVAQAMTATADAQLVP
jgi:hypothetical protein